MKLSNARILPILSNSHAINGIILSYLLLPLILFAFGWLKPFFAFILAVIVVFSSILVFSSTPIERFPLDLKKLRILFFSLLILFIWVLFSGIGGYGLQSWDFHGRNAILRDLISHSWPVYYDYSQTAEMATLFGKEGKLVYYFNFFLPAAAIGKLFGWNASNLFLFIWCFIGLALVNVLIYRFFHKASLWILLGFIFFSGMDILGSMGTTAEMSKFALPAGIIQNILGTKHLEWWAGSLFQYSSITTQLFNVFNQAIPTWIITLIILQLKERKNLFFYYCLLFLYAPLPFLGLFPFVVYQFFHLRNDDIKSREFIISTWKTTGKEFLKNNLDWITYQNLIGSGFLMLISFAFLSSNVGHHSSGLIWQFQHNLPGLIFIYLIFCLIEFFALGLLLHFANVTKGLLWVSLFSLLLIPLFKYGRWNDFAMRVSIPALLVLFLLSVSVVRDQTMKEKTNSAFKLRFFIIIALLLGALTPLHEIHRSIRAVIILKEFPHVSDSWKSFDYGGYLDKMETVPNFVVGESMSKGFLESIFK